MPAGTASITGLLSAHGRWRAECWNLIASENLPGLDVDRLLVNELSHRYGDYDGIDPSRSKYRGNRYIVQMEQACAEAACRLFGAVYAEIRPLSGHIAGIAPMMALARPGDAIAELDQAAVGHRLAAKMINCPLVHIRALPLPFDAETFNVDVTRTLELIERERPRIVILGSSGFLFPHPVAAIREGIRALGTSTILQYDGSHVLGLIAGGVFQKPLEEGADLITSSSHKTLGGPQGGLILCNDLSIAEAVGRAVQPGLQANHHLQRIPALHRTFEEWMTVRRGEAARVVETAQALAGELDAAGIPVVAKHLGYTRSHTVLVQPGRLGAAGKLELALEEGNVIAGACKLPQALGGEGLRIGVQEFVRRGLLPSDAGEVAAVIAGILKGDLAPEDARKRVRALIDKVSARAQ